MKKYCFGIDVGGTTVKMGLFTTEGELLDKWEIPTRKEDGGAYILNDVAASVEAKLAEKNIAKEDVAGAGIGVPGPTLDTGYVSICVNLGWKDKNPANELSELLSIPVKAGNDANVAALGEMWKGGGEGYLDVVLLTLGTAGGRRRSALHARVQGQDCGLHRHRQGQVPRHGQAWRYTAP